MLHRLPAPALLLALAITTACAAKQPAARPPDVATPPVAPVAATTPVDHTEHIDHITRNLLPAVQIAGETATYELSARMQHYKVPALAIAVFADYRLLWARSWGIADVATATPVADHTLFQAGSISKSVHALAVLQAVADGQLALDVPINQYLTTWKLPDNELTRATPVTLRQLLSHTAGTTVHGFPGYADGEPLPTLPQILDGTPPANTSAVRVTIAPGSRFQYSGGGTTISQLALVEQTKQPYPELLAARVLVPLGMTASSYAQPLPPARLQHAAAGHGRDGSSIAGKRHLYPEMAAAGLWTTPTDLARFYIELALARAGRSQRIPQALAAQMTTAVAPIDGTTDSIGLGVFLSDRNGARFFGHGGADAGFQADAIASLDGGYGLVVMANSDNGFSIFAEVERTVFAEYAWPGADPILQRFAVTPDQRARFVGRYLDERLPRIVTLVGDELRSHYAMGAEAALVPIAADTVVALADGERLQVAPDGALLLSHPGGPPRTLVPLPATTSHPLLELDAGRFDAAVALWRKQARRDPKAARDDERFANGYGYFLLGERPERGRELMRLISTVFPDSANAHDSLADAHLANNDTALAIGEYQRALATLAADPRISAADRPRQRARISAQLARVRADAAK